MRDSNYKSVSSNKAAVTITTSLYDRRALEVTSDKPLVNSLNHLTYLVSSSAKVRETLSNDGGIERLIEILHECHNLTFNLKDNIFNSEKKLLTAWKWTLAFQCLVLVGTRGTEKIRQKVVKAGMLPIIATVLDNYLTIHERTFLHANVRPGCGHENFNCQQPSTQLRLSNESNVNPQQQRPPAQQQQQNRRTLNTQRNQPPTLDPQVTNRTAPTQDTGLLFTTQHNQPQSNMNMENLNSQPDSAPATASESFPEVGSTQEVAFDNTTTNNNNNNTNNNNRNINTAIDNATSNFLNQIDSFSSSTFPIQITPSLASDTVTSTSIPNSNSMPNFFNGNRSDNLTSDDYDSLTVDQLFKLVHVNGISGTQFNNNGVSTNKSLANNDIKRRYLIVNIIKKLREEKEDDLLDDKFLDDNDYEMDNGLQFLSDLYLQEDRNIHLGNMVTSKSAPRSFTETGVVIPRDDDIVWSLQLLAYISKYPHLKEILQNTDLVIDMSIRDKQLKLYLQKQMKMKLKKQQKINSRPTMTPKLRRYKFFNRPAPENGNNSLNSIRNINPITTNTYLERFNASASSSPQMLNDINSIQNEDFILDEDKLDLCNNKPDVEDLIEDAEAEDDEDDFDDKNNEDDEDEEYLSCLAGTNLKSEENSSYLSKLYDSIIDAESIVNDLDREIALFHISDKINRYIELESKKLSNSIIQKRLEKKKYLKEKWNYDTYDSFDIDDEPFGYNSNEENDYDDSLVEYKKFNLFPMVEKFTFLAGTDMYYWSGVIMRNSCRRNDFKGGVRQCGNLECGKWEKYPREFSKCRRCKRTKYCSRECQMKAWHCHRNWCIPSNLSNTTSNTGNSATNSNYGNTASNINESSADDGANNNNTNTNGEDIYMDHPTSSS